MHPLTNTDDAILRAFPAAAEDRVHDLAGGNIELNQEIAKLLIATRYELRQIIRRHDQWAVNNQMTDALRSMVHGFDIEDLDGALAELTPTLTEAAKERVRLWAADVVAGER